MKLSSVSPGKYEIKEVHEKRLIELGFVPGRKIDVLVNKGHMVISLDNEKFAISRDIAEGVEVG